ncbi:hypothetical protein A3860_27950 [Niastella vici]|uniref:Uncharacterized protein n=1 Tax=Niastella vici TaxID=1703345 RepID=A0A1V9FVZ0_9BACT|nr:polysaccharide biosynthesis C-terminal domain-containing protein [Niastella vici]OQP62529.1 hypothetical protein A3860_27950 [Niastella vici]
MKLLQSILEKILKSDLPKEERTRLVKGLIHSFIIQGISIVMVFTGNYLLVKFFGAEIYGVYVHVFNWISVLTVLAMGGQEDIVLSRMPKYMAQNNRLQIGAIIRHSNTRVAINSILISGLFLLLIQLFPVPTLSKYRPQFMVAAGTIYLSVFLTFNQYVLQALNHIRLSQVTERLLKPFVFTLFIAGAGWLSIAVDASRLIGIALINLVICALVLLWLVIKKTKPYFSKGTERYKGEGVSKQAFYFLSISLLQLLATRIGMLIMPYFIEEKNIGIFNIAARFSDIIIYPFYLLHSMLPQLFAKHHSAELSYKQKLYSESTWIIMITSLPLLATNIVVGPWLLGHLFGSEFTAGYPALVLMSASNALFGIFGPANTILMMQGKEKQSAFALVVNVILLTVLSRLLIPTQGVTGVAWAMLISNILYNILLAIFARYHTGVMSPFFIPFAKRYRV